MLVLLCGGTMPRGGVRSLLVALFITGALGLGGVTWGSYILGEFVPFWLWEQLTLSSYRLVELTVIISLLV